MTGILIKRLHGDTEVQEERSVRMKADIGGLVLRAEEGWQPLEARREAEASPGSRQPSKRASPYRHLDFRFSTSRTVRE